MVRVEGLEDRVAVVTGGGRGIGLAICRVLVANGARVAALDLTPPDEPGMLGIEADVSDEAAVNAAFDEVERGLGPVTVLVLNAGILPLVPLEETSAELWERTLAINLTGGVLRGPPGAARDARARVRPGGRASAPRSASPAARGRPPTPRRRPG